MDDELFKQRANEENGQIISVCNLPKTLSAAIRDFVVKCNPENKYKVPVAWIDWAETLELPGDEPRDRSEEPNDGYRE